MDPSAYSGNDTTLTIADGDRRYLQLGAASAIAFDKNSDVILTSATQSTGLDSGALQVTGGMSVDKQMHVGGQFHAIAGLASTSTATGSIRCTGGMGITGDINSSGNITTSSASTSSIVTAGGASFAKRIIVSNSGSSSACDIQVQGYPNTGMFFSTNSKISFCTAGWTPLQIFNSYIYVDRPLTTTTSTDGQIRTSGGISAVDAIVTAKNLSVSATANTSHKIYSYHSQADSLTSHAAHVSAGSNNSARTLVSSTSDSYTTYHSTLDSGQYWVCGCSGGGSNFSIGYSPADVQAYQLTNGIRIDKNGVLYALNGLRAGSVSGSIDTFTSWIYDNIGGSALATPWSLFLTTVQSSTIFTRAGKQITFNINFKANLTNGGLSIDLVDGTIPVGFRPLQTYIVNQETYVAGSMRKMTVQITTAGGISILRADGTNHVAGDNFQSATFSGSFRVA